MWICGCGWPGNTKIRDSMMCCPFRALLTWISVCGNRPGYLFCTVNQNNMICTEQAWPNTGFVRLLWDLLGTFGVWSGDVMQYPGHSLKRWCVQSYRALEMKEGEVLEIIQKSGFGDQAYSNYLASYNDWAPTDISIYKTIDGHMAHAETIYGWRMSVTA